MRRRSNWQCPKCGQDVGHVMRQRGRLLYVTQVCPCGWDDDLEPRYEIEQARVLGKVADSLPDERRNGGAP